LASSVAVQKSLEVTSLCSPLPLLKAAGLDWRGPLHLSRPEPASRSGFSLSHNDRYRATVIVSSFPTCFFNASWDRPRVRSARGSSLTPVRPGAGGLNAACPLPRFQSFDPGLASSPLPLRGVRPSGSLRSPICYREARLPKPPDLPWLPAFGTPTADSSLRVRDWSGGWLFLKPLGTSIIFLPLRSESQSDSKVPIFRIQETALMGFSQRADHVSLAIRVHLSNARSRGGGR
jgi:hypothetical protein